MHGTSGHPTTLCQVLGAQGKPKMDALISQHFKGLMQIAECVRTDAEEGSSKEIDLTSIPNLVKHCSKTDLCLPNSKTTSGFKDMHVVIVRLGLGELLAAVVRQEDAGYIGCEQKMFEEGIKCLDVWDKLVHKSKSARSYSRGQGEKCRPNVQAIVSGLCVLLPLENLLWAKLRDYAISRVNTCSRAIGTWSPRSSVYKPFARQASTSRLPEPTPLTVYTAVPQVPPPLYRCM